MTTRISWKPVIERAVEVAGSARMTLRQCFYILVSEGLIPNADASYKRLSSLSAEGRREGWFPAFIDGTREIFQYRSFDGIEDAIGSTARAYRRDRTEGQPFQVWIAGEKRTLAAQLHDWFADLGVPIVVCAGYSSQTLCDDVRAELDADGREAVLVYAGDFDPSGEDIARDFIARVGAFDNVQRVAVLPGQVESLGLTPFAGKASDTRSAGFVARHGSLVQVEVEAVHPKTLRGLYRDAIDTVWDTSAYATVLEREERERDGLLKLLAEAAEWPR